MHAYLFGFLLFGVIFGFDSIGKTANDHQDSRPINGLQIESENKTVVTSDDQELPSAIQTVQFISTFARQLLWNDFLMMSVNKLEKNLARLSKKKIAKVEPIPKIGLSSSELLQGYTAKFCFAKAIEKSFNEKYSMEIRAFYSSKPERPEEVFCECIRFCSRSGGLCVLTPEIRTTMAFNINRTTDRQRAWNIATSISPRFLKALAEAFKQTPVDCVGIGIAYRYFDPIYDESADFSSNGEYMAIFATKESVLSFVTAQMTEEDFFKQVECYLSDADTELGRVKRIQLVPR